MNFVYAIIILTFCAVLAWTFVRYYERYSQPVVQPADNDDPIKALPVDWRPALRVVITEAIAEWQREGNGPNSYNPNERGGLPQTTLWIDKADQFGKVATDAAISYIESVV